MINADEAGRLYELFYNEEQGAECAFAHVVLALWYETKGADTALCSDYDTRIHHSLEVSTAMNRAKVRVPKACRCPEPDLHCFLNMWFERPTLYMHKLLARYFAHGEENVFTQYVRWSGMTIRYRPHIHDKRDTVVITIYMSMDDAMPLTPALTLTCDKAMKPPVIRVDNSFLYPFGMAFIAGIHDYFVTNDFYDDTLVDVSFRPRITLIDTPHGDRASASFPVARIVTPFWQIDDKTERHIVCDIDDAFAATRRERSYDLTEDLLL